MIQEMIAYGPRQNYWHPLWKQKLAHYEHMLNELYLKLQCKVYQSVMHEVILAQYSIL